MIQSRVSVCVEISIFTRFLFVNTMVKTILLLLLILLPDSILAQPPVSTDLNEGGRNEEPTLKSALAEKFLIGCAMNSNQFDGTDSVGAVLIARQFNSIVAENCMKSSVIHPEENRYDFTLADRFVRFGEKHQMFIIGHCLIWHSQLAPWFCVDSLGANVTPEVLKARMKKHIFTIVGRYKGRVKGWDVVNEAIEDNGDFRQSKFYEILGEDFISLAFRYAHEADPEAELYYNDYSMSNPGRVAAVVRMVGKLKGEGLRIDAIGMQSHLSMEYPRTDEYEQALVTFGKTGCKVMITELDMTVLPSPFNGQGAEVSNSASYEESMNPYADHYPDAVSVAWNQRMAEFFGIYIRHADIVSRVTLWGLTDQDSWRNNWPIAGRTDYPLLFDRNYRAKTVVKLIMKDA